jgi:hypothetical protein
MLLGLLLPASRGAPIHLIDAWDPDVVLDAVLTDDLSAGSGATVFLTSLLGHPAFSDDHRASHDVGRPRRLVGAQDDRDRRPRSRASAPCDRTTHRDADGERREPRRAGRPAYQYRWSCTSRGRDAHRHRRRHRRAPGEAGEIVARGPDLFSGYTDAVLTDEFLDRDGWFGDR